MDMPHSAKVLYFYLMIEADDDGFVSNPRTIGRMINAAEDDMKVLKAKRFVLDFESGICVIKHWRVHNLIRADRYTGTQWIEEKSLLKVDEETKKYSLATTRQPDGTQVAPQVRLGKVSKGKERLGEHTNVCLSEDELKKLHELMGEQNTSLLIEELSDYLASTNKKYKSHYATLRSWARRRAQEGAKGTKNQIADIS